MILIKNKLIQYSVKKGKKSLKEKWFDLVLLNLKLKNKNVFFKQPERVVYEIIEKIKEPLQIKQINKFNQEIKYISKKKQLNHAIKKCLTEKILEKRENITNIIDLKKEFYKNFKNNQTRTQILNKKKF